MANIEKLSGFVDGEIITQKINEIIEWVNGVTATRKVQNISIENNKLTITYLNGVEETIDLQNTTYSIANTNRNGLISVEYMSLMSSLKSIVGGLSSAYDAYKREKQRADSSSSSGSDSDSGGGDSDYGGSDTDSDTDSGTGGGSTGGSSGNTGVGDGENDNDAAAGGGTHD